MAVDKIDKKEEVEEYFKLYKSINNKEYLDRISDYFKEKNDYGIEIKFEDISELDAVNSNGETLLSILLSNFRRLDYKVKEVLSNNYKVVNKMIEEDNYLFTDHIKTENFFWKYKNYDTLFDFLLEKEKMPYSRITSIYGHKEIIDKILKKDPTLLQYLNETHIVNENINGEPLIDYMFRKHLVTEETIDNLILNVDIFIDKAFYYHQENILCKLNSFVLEQEKDGKTTLMEDLIKKGVVFKEGYFDKKLLDVLLKYKQFGPIKKLRENDLLKDAYNGKTYLENLLENKEEVDILLPKKEETLYLFLKYERYDDVLKFPLNMLLNKIDEEMSPLDIVFSEYKKGLNVNLTKIGVLSRLNDPKSIADFYLKVAEYGLINHVNVIESDWLFYEKDGEKVIDVLLRENQELTTNVILKNKTKQDFKVASYLRSKGIDQKNIKLDLLSTDIIDEYYDGYVREYNQEKITEKQEELLQTYKKLMLSDNKSNPKYVEALASSYRHMMFMENEYGERELRKLIEIKEKDPEHSIKEGKSGFYQEYDNSIYVSNSCINTLNHETGHLLFHNLTDKEVPIEYYQMINELRNDPSFLQKVEEYSHAFHKIRDKVIKVVDEVYIPNYESSIDDEKKEKINAFLNDSKEKKKAEFIEAGYNEETVETILSSAFSIDEYLEQDKRIKREELVDAILRTKYGAFISLGDIFDGILNGKFGSGELLNSYGNAVPQTYGHGIAYYKKAPIYSFDETMANYSAIIKSDEAYEAMGYLRSIAGEEFVNLIDNYYNKEISLSTKEVAKVSR